MHRHRRLRHSGAPNAPQVAMSPFIRAGLSIRHLETAKDPKNKGTFEAHISTFNRRVSYGFPGIPDDRILPGSMAASIERGFPSVSFSHMFEENPPIGVTEAIEEREDVLWARGRLFTETNQTAREVWTAMTEVGGDGRPALREFSISGPILKWTLVQEDDQEIRDINELDLWEWGPCLRGANETELLEVGGEPVESGSTEETEVTEETEETVENTATSEEEPPASREVKQSAVIAPWLILPRH